MIDLSDRIIQPATVTRAPNGNLKWHPYRRVLQLLCGLLFVVLPLTDGMRLDVRRSVFYFAWHRMAAQDLYLLFWVSMLATWGLVVVSFLYGRLWCGWVCPQTAGSDFVESLKTRIDKALHVRKFDPSSAGIKINFLMSRALWGAVVLALSLGTGIILACYWLDPHTVFAATKSPFSDIAAGLTVYGITAVIAVDLLWVRRRFCSSACPYGMLISMMADRETLAVRYLDERDSDCIRCGKCVTDCPMDIDIKQGVGQLACIGCGECVDACNDVLGRRGLPGLIEYRYGTEPERQTKRLTFLQKWGMWDSKRYAAVATLGVCLGFVIWNLIGHVPVQLEVTADGAITRDARAVHNAYTLSIANGAPIGNDYTVTVSGLPPGAMVDPSTPVHVSGGGHRLCHVTLSVPAASAVSGRRLPVIFHVRHGTEQAEAATIFYAP